MSMLSEVKKGRQTRPRRTVLYGTHGVGKSTFASKFPDPIFIQTEDGCADLDVAKLPLCQSLIDAMGAIIELGGGGHEFKTVVVDSIDWLEKLVWKKVCESEGKKSITDFAYGSGYGKSASMFSDVLNGLNCCRDVGMHVVLIAHCEIKRFENPEGDSYDRYCPKLHRDTAALMQEWADEVLFVNWKVNVRKTDQGGFNKEGRGVGVGGDERVMRTVERPGFLAKNRLGMPDELPFDFAEYAKFVPGLA